MLNTTIVGRRTTKQDVHNHTETNVEASGNISRQQINSRFICIDKSKQSFKTIFSSAPFYTEKEQVDDGKTESMYHRGIYNPYYKEIIRKIYVNVLQVLVVGSEYTLEVQENSKEETSSGSRDKSIYYNIPTIV